MLLLPFPPPPPPVITTTDLSLPRTARYTPTIIWGTGTTLDTSLYDDVSGYYLNQPGLQLDGIGRDQIRAYAPPAAPAFDLTLNNWGGEFSPGGPIGNLVGRGPVVTLDAAWGVDYVCVDNGVPVTSDLVLVNGLEEQRLFDGTINTVQHVLTRPQRNVAIRALGILSTLLDKRPVTTQLYENIRTDVAISIILDLVGWPADQRVLDTGDTILTYFWLDGSQTGLTVLNQLLGAEGAGGCAYEQAGVFHFEGRQYRANASRSLTPQWIFSSTFATDPPVNDPGTLVNDPDVLVNGVVPGQVLHDIIPSETQANPDEVVSGVTANVNVRVPNPPLVVLPTVQTYMKVWEYGGPLLLAPGEILDVIAPTQELYKLAQLPVAETDYTTTIGSASGSVTMSLLWTSGHRVGIHMVAGAGGANIYGATSAGPQLRAVSLPVASELVIRSTVDTSASALRYSPREHHMDAWPEVGRSQMLDVVNSMTRRYQQERRQSTIRVFNLDGDHMRAIMHARISDRVVWVQRHGGLNDPYWIEQISHDISPGGSNHTMVLGCERTFDFIGGRFDIGVVGSNGFNIDHFGD